MSSGKLLIGFQFEIRSGKVYFGTEETKTVKVRTSGIEDLTVIATPKGWYADVNSDGNIEITSPVEGDYSAADAGYVKVHACSVDGRCLVGRVLVQYSGKCQISLAAYAGKMDLKAASKYTSFFYGVSTRESFESDAEALLAIVEKALQDGDWDQLSAISNSSYAWESTDGYDGTLKLDLETIYGSALEIGKEYVVWAFLENMETFTIDDVVAAYYTHNVVEVTVTEGEKSPYDVMVNVAVSGVDSYHAVAIPRLYAETEEALLNFKEQMAMAATQGEVFGLAYSANYSGSAYAIAEGSTFSMTGSGAPYSSVYVMILPIDGRPEYTAEDIIVAELTTGPITSGGTVNAIAEQVWFEYEVQYDYSTGAQTNVEKPINAIDYPSVKVNASATGWKSMYYGWFSDEELATFATEADLVAAVVKSTMWAMTPTDISLPCTILNYETTYDKPNCVVFFVDESDKHGEIANVKCEVVSTPDGKQLTFTWADLPTPGPAAFDFGVGIENKFCITYDMVTQYGAAALPVEMHGFYEPYNSMTWDYLVSPISKTEGIIEVYQYDYYGDRQKTTASYSNWDGESCVIDFETFAIENQTMTVASAPINVYYQQAGGMEM